MASTSRSYAGVLAVVAFLVTLFRGISLSHAPTDAIANSLIALVLFAIIGGVVGWIAERTIAECVKQSVMNKDG